VRTTWAPVGQTPILTQEGSWKKLAAIGALSLQPSGRINEQFQILPHNATVMDFVNFLIEVRRRYGKPLIVVWDRLKRHGKTEALMKFCDAHWIEFYQLPSYAPELNPVEGLWSCTKGGELANFAPRNLFEL
jgi:putative transposase